MMAPKIAASETAAQFFHKSMFSGAKDGEDKARFSGVLGEVDPSVVHLVSLAFRNPLALHRYSLLISEFFAEHNERIIPPLAMRTLVVAGDADRIAHPAGSAKVQSALPNSRFENLPGGDHYSVIFDDYVAESILEFTGVSSKVLISQERDGDVSKSEVSLKSGQ
jgi:pimeloyl-ACP methyl ester carboxylesterase